MNTPEMPRRSFITRLSAGAATTLVAVPAVRAAGSRSQRGRDGRALQQPAFRPLPLGAIRPQGWLQRQLRIQADGLSGHLDRFWPDVAESQWFGGKAEGWERAPYWLDGVIPLAWQLDDAPLKKRLEGYLRHIVAAQRPDGWYAPYPADAGARRYDLWAILLADKVLAQYHEATGDPAVLEALVRNLRALHAVLAHTPLHDWGRYRWFEGLIPVYYVYERTGEDWLLDLARRLHEQGFDYAGFYAGDDIRSPTPRRGLWTWEKHVVNTAMALKAYALSWRLSGADRERAMPARMLETLDRYHGQVTGMFTGDECLAGRSPTQGTELCAVVEAMYSLELVVATTGDAAMADRLERIAYNALPAAISPDMWSHQYDQQVNQVQCTINPDHMWSSNGPESNLFGLEPNYGCCTANMHQGWPKFAAHLWMQAPGGGPVAVAYAPCSARLLVEGVPVRVVTDTDYPFRDTVRITVTPEARRRFPVLLRIPGWAQGATVRVGGGRVEAVRPGSFHRIERAWADTTDLELRLPMTPKVTSRYNQAVSIERGPLVYGLKIEETWTRVNADKPHRELPHADFEVRPASPWNYGLILDPAAAAGAVSFEERPVGERPFSPEGAGVIGRVRGRRLPNWKLEHGWAAEIPPAVQSSEEPIEELTLIPYGCSNLRVAEFPRAKA